MELTLAHATLRDRIRSPLRIATLFSVLFFAGFGTWSALAPLTGAAVAHGFIGVENKRQTIQHLEGGIIERIIAREGDRVEAGDLLVRLDDTVPKSTYDLLEGQYVDLIVERARLEAEQVEAEVIEWPDLLAVVSDRTRVTRAMRVQQELFQARREALASRAGLLNAGIRQLEEQIRGLDAQESATQRQRGLVRKETAAVEQLVEQGLQSRPRLYALQRTSAQMDGALGDIASQKAQARLLIGKSRLELLDLKTQTRNQVVGDLRDLSARIADMQPRLRAARDKLNRLELRAPMAGTIVGMQFHTEGGVIGPGAPVLDLVPTDAPYVIEARLSPQDIDIVRAGLPAEIRLVAFSSRITPTLPGRVVHVSADSLFDRKSEQSYYEIKVELQVDPLLLRQHKVDLDKLYPGMPVEVMLVTGQRTLLDYVLQPVTDMFARAFRET
ncbi:HlyD family type I secretion periplasmic adaptor subunit [Nitratireductor sp. StC3]|uniref:HlyD family type I secretion periplasmic adaptor subunit n=1 Tax=Nitratireductor sp. StC3 TaxID=2126741 RepID=UPI000D0DFC1B|nr:HlyD family type I secretion periplasmic adaptor subunit [Nitratireductor sp. StC3]PSM18321.1 HlyD family type I secretion periplasmic adaptor subunit [Nitratireductor sp. StC3]